ncbi:hypothetical protein BCR25_09125 [Enterococcus termitis]|uniref:Lactococcin 972 family bacteriocin n=1 Tax=Enterococcus termitis TaxID=332950 RepID=A0A1E5GDP5_9ENTE|nr:hypothetical protein BCR25_09125 [Enterococcus termitis]OJG97876.1 hypothetical protein RV18_GL003890 [Enterococcus termitis]
MGLSLVAVCIPTSANAEEVGGWSENEGNYLNPNVVLPRATVKHTGKRETKNISGTTNSRAHGWTTWQGVRHYTTAQMERYYTGKVVTTSGRKYGTSGTEAISPWFKPAYGEDTAAARTYYGR